MARDFRSDLLGDPGPNHVPHRRPSEVIEDLAMESDFLTGISLGFSEIPSPSTRIL